MNYSVYGVVGDRYKLLADIKEAPGMEQHSARTGWMLVCFLGDAIAVGRHVYPTLEAAQHAAESDGNQGEWQGPWRPSTTEGHWVRGRTTGGVAAQEMQVH